MKKKISLLAFSVAFLLSNTGNAARSLYADSVTNLSRSMSFTFPTANGSSLQFLQTNGSGVTSWATPTPAVANLSVVSKTTTYSATTSDDMILGSGSAFTITLPTAVGNSGKTFYLKKTDASLSNIITIATTSSQTIDGVTSVTLNTQNEILILTSDGSNYQIREHTWSTAWVNFPSTAAGTLITGTSVNPVYGTVNENIARYRRIGSSIEVFWSYNQGAAGTNGTGTFLFNLPSGLTIDTSITGTNSAADNRRSLVGTFHYSNNNGANIFIGNAGVWSSTQIYFYLNQTGIVWGSSVNYFGTSNQGFGVHLILPMSGWLQ